MANIEISPLLETWKIANTTFQPLALPDVPGLNASNPLPPPKANGDLVWWDALDYTTSDILAASDNFRNGVNGGSIVTEGYKHTHKGLYDPTLIDTNASIPDASSWHTHTGLEILTGGVYSNADSLHTHSGFTTTEDVDLAISNAIGDVDLSVYVTKDGGINQLSDITSDGAVIEDAVLKAHDEEHSLLDHIDTVEPYTVANFKKLFNGSNADCLHTHSTGGGGGTFDGEHNDLDGLNDGDYIHLTASQVVDFTTLTDGSNADLLHTHDIPDISGVHNELDGLQGGSILNPSNEEYYHLDYDQYISLIGGPSVNADEYHTHNFATTAYEIPLGATCDGDWTGGLFPWDEDYLTSCALDDINEVLGALAPPAAPVLDDISVDTNGVTGDVSFDVSNPIAEATYVGVAGIGSLPAVTVDNSFTNSGDRVGIINASTDITGTLNEDVEAHEYSYPSNAFGNAELGNLILEINGVEVRNIDLTTEGAVNDGISVSGFNISDKTSCEFSNGYPFVQFQYRTGTYRVDSNDENVGYGWNYARVIHRIGSSDTVTNYVDWVVDANTTSTAYSGIVFDNLIMTGSSYLSGVRYYTDGTADYDITIDHGQRNTYIDSSAITFIETNGTVSNLSFSATGGNELQQTVITDRTFTISGNIRLLNDNISNITRVNRTVQSDINSSSASITNILMDDLISAAGGEDDNSESFRAEGYRLSSDLDITDTNYSPSAYLWDSAESLVGSDAGHNDGLLECNDRLSYPSNTTDNNIPSGDFRNISDGGAIVYGYSGNPNYSGASGERVYLRYFYNSSSRQNFNFVFNVSNTTFVSSSNIGSLSGNNVACEILAPNTTIDGSSAVEWKDMVTAYSTDTAIGAYAGTYGSSIPTNWGVTIGTKSTASSGNVIVIRVTAPSSWSGTINSIECNFL